MSMNTKLLWLGGGILLIGVVVGLVLQAPSSEELPVSENTPKKLSVVTTLFPLYDFAKAIGGEYAEVTLLLPPGVESHSFEPKPSDIVRINQSDVFVFTGSAMEPWADDVRRGIKSSVSVVDASQGIELMKESEEMEEAEESEEMDHEHEGESEHADHSSDHEEAEEHHHHGGADPHIWLDFENAARMMQAIAEAMMAKDPKNADAYRRNAEAYRLALDTLDESYRSGLANCETRTVVYGGHYAFGYLAKRYNLQYMSAQGFSPDSEPTAKDLIALTEQVKMQRIGAVFYEELASPKIAETIARETGAQLLLLNAAHNIGRDDVEKGTTFLDIMGENRENLRIGLGCW